MGGELNWSAIPLVAGLLGVRDPEAFIVSLAGIRDGLMKSSRERDES
jgi:hypothetical protein